jgi:hypothetical protein
MAEDDVAKAGVCCCGTFCITIFVFLIMILANIYNLGPEEQVIVITKFDRVAHNGPDAKLLNIFVGEKIRREAVRLGPRQYASVKHSRTQERRHEVGPQLFFLDAWEELVGVYSQIILRRDDYIRLVDASSGGERVLHGPLMFTPRPLEGAPNGTQKAILLSPEMSVLLMNKTTGLRSLYTETGLFFLRAYEQIIEVRHAVVVGPRQFATVKNVLSGLKENRAGPVVIKLDAYEDLDGPVKPKLLLQFNEYVRLVDERTGNERVIAGPASIVPHASEVYTKIEKSIRVGEATTVKTRNETSGLKWTACRCEPNAMDVQRDENAGGIFSPGPYEKVVEVQVPTLVTPSKYAVIENERDGIIRHIDGPTLLHLGAYDKLVEVREKIVMEKDQFVRLVDKKTGVERIIGGPARVVPQPTEVYPPAAGVENVVFLDDDAAVLVLNKTTGFKQLITRADHKSAQPGVFVPKPYEYIVEIQKVVRVLPYEAMVLRDQVGAMTIHQGTGTQGTYFFIPAYSEIVTHYWSSYGVDAKTLGEKVPSTRLDLRERKTPYTYEVRTADNVKLSLSGMVYWRTVNVDKLMRTTPDAEGDVYQKSRSALIQAVSATKFQAFMKRVGGVAEDAFRIQQPPTDMFLEKRGLVLEGLELTNFECLDNNTNQILKDIIMTTIDGVKREEYQKSENAVKKVKTTGDIAEAMKRTQLIQAYAHNNKLRAEMAGQAAGLRKVFAASVFIDGLASTISNETSRVGLYKLREEVQARNADTAIIGASSGTLFMDPVDSNLHLGSVEL